MDQREMFLETIRHVAKLCAVAAMTAPKSGGQLFLKGGKPFIETVIVEDKATLRKLADWLRKRGEKQKQAIWFRDADTAEALDLVLFIGLSGWYLRKLSSKRQYLLRSCRIRSDRKCPLALPVPNLIPCRQPDYSSQFPT